jgi:hypothetical protein
MGINGMFVAMELKKSLSDVPRGGLDLQAHKIGKINATGNIGFFVYPENWERIKTILTTLSKGGHYDRINVGSN